MCVCMSSGVNNDIIWFNGMIWDDRPGAKKGVKIGRDGAPTLEPKTS